MKKLFLAIFILLIFVTSAVAQSGLINPDQLNNNVDVTAIAGENLTAGNLYKLLNVAGTPGVYGYRTSFGPSTLQTIANKTPTYTTSQYLGNNYYVTFFRNNDDSYKPYYIVCYYNTVNGNINAGTATKINDTPVTFLESALVDTNKIALGVDDGSYGQMYVGTVDTSTLTMTFGSAEIFSKDTGGASRRTTHFGLCKLDTNKIGVAYRDVANDRTYLKATTISGTTISAFPNATDSNFSGTTHNWTSCIDLDTDKMIVAGLADTLGKSVVVTFSGTTPTVGTPVTFSSSAPNSSIRLIRLDTNKVFIGYPIAGGYSKVICGTISGTVPTFGSIVSANGSYSPTATAIVKINTDKVAHVCSTNSLGYAIICSVSGTTISTGAEYSFGYDVLWSSMISPATNTFITIFQKGTGAYMYGFAKYAPSTAVTPIQTTTSSSFLPVIAKTSITAGSLGSYSVLRPFCKVTNTEFSFAPHNPYFLDANGAWSTTANANYYVGFSLDTTSIFIDGCGYLNSAGGLISNETLPVSLIRQ